MSETNAQQYTPLPVPETATQTHALATTVREKTGQTLFAKVTTHVSINPSEWKERLGAYRNIKNPNLMPLKGVAKHPDYPGHRTAYYPYIENIQLLSQSLNTLDAEHAYTVYTQVAQVVADMHSIGATHGRILPHNIALVDGNALVLETGTHWDTTAEPPRRPQMLTDLGNLRQLANALPLAPSIKKAIQNHPVTQDAQSQLAVAQQAHQALNVTADDVDAMFAPAPVPATNTHAPAGGLGVPAPTSQPAMPVEPESQPVSEPVDETSTPEPVEQHPIVPDEPTGEPVAEPVTHEEEAPAPVAEPEPTLTPAPSEPVTPAAVIAPTEPELGSLPEPVHETQESPVTDETVEPVAEPEHQSPSTPEPESQPVSEPVDETSTPEPVEQHPIVPDEPTGEPVAEPVTHEEEAPAPVAEPEPTRLQPVYPTRQTPTNPEPHEDYEMVEEDDEEPNAHLDEMFEEQPVPEKKLRRPLFTRPKKIAPVATATVPTTDKKNTTEKTSSGAVSVGTKTPLVTRRNALIGAGGIGALALLGIGGTLLANSKDNDAQAADTTPVAALDSNTKRTVPMGYQEQFDWSIERGADSKILANNAVVAVYTADKMSLYEAGTGKSIKEYNPEGKITGAADTTIEGSPALIWVTDKNKLYGWYEGLGKDKDAVRADIPEKYNVSTTGAGVLLTDGKKAATFGKNGLVDLKTSGALTPMAVDADNKLISGGFDQPVEITDKDGKLLTSANLTAPDNAPAHVSWVAVGHGLTATIWNKDLSAIPTDANEAMKDEYADQPVTIAVHSAETGELKATRDTTWGAVRETNWVHGQGDKYAGVERLIVNSDGTEKTTLPEELKLTKIKGTVAIATTEDKTTYALQGDNPAYKLTQPLLAITNAHAVMQSGSRVLAYPSTLS